MNRQSPAVEPVLSLVDLEVAYGKASAIRGINIDVGPTEIVTIVGRNGAGKTSTMRGASGFTRPESGHVASGKVVFLGNNVEGRDPTYAARLGLRLVPERDKVFNTLTVTENLEVSAQGARRDEDVVFEVFPELGDKRPLKAGYLSGGQKQMLGIAMALQSLPKVLLIDELSLGLAPGIVNDLMGRILTLRDRLDMAFMIVEQNVNAVVPISDRVYVLDGGEVIARFDDDLDADKIGDAMLAGDRG